MLKNVSETPVKKDTKIKQSSIIDVNNFTHKTEDAKQKNKKTFYYFSLFFSKQMIVVDKTNTVVATAAFI